MSKRKSVVHLWYPVSAEAVFPDRFGEKPIVCVARSSVRSMPKGNVQGTHDVGRATCSRCLDQVRMLPQLANLLAAIARRESAA